MVPIASVVIPAHNEEAVLGRCLRRLTEQARPDELDIVVVANACTDTTGRVARTAGVRVVETPVPGKAHALVLGDRTCHAFPRLYLDADVELDIRSIRRMVAALAESGASACSPAPEFDLAGASRLAQRFHRVHGRLQSGRRALSGAGAYLLTETAHRQAFPLPDVLADDGWVSRHIVAGERIVVESARVSVRPPLTLPAIVRRRARVRLGNRQLDRLGVKASAPPLRAGSLAELVRQRNVSVPDAACFLAVLLAERTVAGWRERRGRGAIWSADGTTRSRNHSVLSNDKRA